MHVQSSVVSLGTCDILKSDVNMMKKEEKKKATLGSGKEMYILKCVSKGSSQVLRMDRPSLLVLYSATGSF